MNSLLSNDQLTSVMMVVAVVLLMVVRLVVVKVTYGRGWRRQGFHWFDIQVDRHPMWVFIIPIIALGDVVLAWAWGTTLTVGSMREWGSHLPLLPRVLAVLPLVIFILVVLDHRGVKVGWRWIVGGFGFVCLMQNVPLLAIAAVLGYLVLLALDYDASKSWKPQQYQPRLGRQRPVQN